MKKAVGVSALFVVALLCGLSTPLANAQAVYGSIIGTVTDPQGAAVANAKVLVVNQNYYRSWQAKDGRKVTSRNGLISVRVEPEDKSVELTYRRTSFTVGLAVSAIGWIALLAAALIDRARAPR